jgi:hypothetical protein
VRALVRYTCPARRKNILEHTHAGLGFVQEAPMNRMQAYSKYDLQVSVITFFQQSIVLVDYQFGYITSRTTNVLDDLRQSLSCS